MRLNIQLNEDLERVLSKLANKRKISLSDLINSILVDWLDEQDNISYTKSLPKKKQT